MPRPRKWKNVCCLPEHTAFGCLNTTNINQKTIRMTVEEYETIRLIDLENLTQEECAKRMNVARATVQKLYNNARNKLADALVNGNKLKIEGGDYRLCENSDIIYCNGCHRVRCGRKR
ncbi:MAG: DUF134 domain-containing protein [Eubacteriales bacterium]|nr:DUF134 domain-containing protein [Eubacteriales bacterium]